MKVRVLDTPQIVDLHDIGVRELGRKLGLTEKHVDEVTVLREVGSDAFDRDVSLEASYTGSSRKKDLCHAADADAL